MIEPLYWGSETNQSFALKTETGEEYKLPDGARLYAIIKEVKDPKAQELLKQDITEDLVLKLKYSDYVNLKIGKTYWLELTIVKNTGEYMPPVFQEQVKIVGVEYGR